MSLEVDEVLATYATERPRLEAACRWVVEELTASLKERGIPARITYRTKDPDSLVKKLIRKGKEYSDVTDKAGVRVVLTYPDDAPIVCDLVKACFAVLECDDKAGKLGPSEFEYTATHFLVPYECEDGGFRAVCEVQVHRPGEALWGTLSHDLTYKAPPGMPRTIKRAIFRLAALTELIDLEAARVRQILMSGEDAAESSLLLALEKPFFRLTGATYDEQLSLLLLNDLLQVVPETPSPVLCDDVTSFCATHESKLRSVFDRKADPIRYPFLFQPETLLVFYLLERDEFLLEDNWPTRLPESEFTKLRNLWGVYA